MTRARTRATERTVEHDADPWWSGRDETQSLPASEIAAARRRRPQAQRRAHRQGRARRVVVFALTWPWLLLSIGMQRSAWFRRLVIRVAIISAIALIVGGSVGVILLNNVIIGRTAELGRLDDERRELQRENALLAAQSAKLSASPVVMFKARTRLHMEQTDTMPKFIYLDPASHTLTPYQRLRRDNVLAQRREAAGQAKDDDSTSTNDTASKSETH